jgi:hypothetical protein
VNTGFGFKTFLCPGQFIDIFTVFAQSQIQGFQFNIFLFEFLRDSMDLGGICSMELENTFYFLAGECPYRTIRQSKDGLATGLKPLRAGNRVPIA